MKRKFLLMSFSLLCIFSKLHAQIDKGNLVLGGSINYSSIKNVQPYNNSQSKNFGANIQIGKAVNRNSVAGLIISYGYYKANIINFSDSDLNKSNQYGAGVFYRKYKTLLKDFYFFGELNLVYTHYDNSQQTLQSGGDGSKFVSKGGSISFVPGLSYQLWKSLQIELTMPNIFSASYVHSETNYNNASMQPVDNKGNNFYVNSNFNSNLLYNFGIGFKFFLGK